VPQILQEPKRRGRSYKLLSPSFLNIGAKLGVEIPFLRAPHSECGKFPNLDTHTSRAPCDCDSFNYKRGFLAPVGGSQIREESTKLFPNITHICHC
jgi:hypothetical protein